RAHPPRVGRPRPRARPGWGSGGTASRSRRRRAPRSPPARRRPPARRTPRSRRRAACPGCAARRHAAGGPPRSLLPPLRSDHTELPPFPLTIRRSLRLYFLSNRRALRLEDSTMQITRTSLPIGTEPKEWFADAACVDTVAGPSGPWRLSASKVHVAPGARAAWHSHRNGRTVAARDGAWLVQRRGSAVEVIGPGERAYFEPGEEH